MSERAAPFYCPYCGDEDLRPVEEDPAAWSCRACARLFVVSLVGIDRASIPAYRGAKDAPEGPS